MGSRQLEGHYTWYKEKVGTHTHTHTDKRIVSNEDLNSKCVSEDLLEYQIN